MPNVARIALDSPLPQLDRVFEYSIPEPLRDAIAPGMRVKVPLRVGGRIVGGWVLEVADEAEYSGRLAKLDSVVSAARVLTPELVGLARAVADRQAGTLADVLRLAIPARSARLEQRWLDDESGERAARAFAAAQPLDAGEPTDLVETAMPTHPAAGIEALPWAMTATEGTVRYALHVPVGVDGTQPRALGALADLVTATLARGESAIVLVPDFRDLELMRAALADRVPAQLVRRFDASLKPMPRYEQFLRALEPVPQIIVGTRSAVWAPAHRLGLIAMWDDGDESYREPHAPYPHTREVALMRATQQDCSLVLAAHAPSLECRRLVSTGWMREAAAPGPASPRIMPTAATIGDDELARAGRIPQLAWQTASRALREGPVLVQVGRAGYRPSLRCSTCRELAHCQRCSGKLMQPQPDHAPSCSVCGAVHAQWRCENCGGASLRAGAIGHERTAEELGRAFPGNSVVVADAERRHITIDDSPALVIATRGAEPIAADGYRAVLLLDAEAALARESLDTVGDALRAWSNAAALAADSAPVVITGGQSEPLEALQSWQQIAIADTELLHRRELDFPPAIRVATIRGTDAEVASAMRRLRDLDLEGIDLLGPVPDTEAEGPRVRATVRFPYRGGDAVAAALKTELVAQATASRRRTAGRRTTASTLRVHLDDPTVFAS